jgi:hypothetical protein
VDSRPPAGRPRALLPTLLPLLRCFQCGRGRCAVSAFCLSMPAPSCWGESSAPRLLSSWAMPSTVSNDSTHVGGVVDCVGVEDGAADAGHHDEPVSTTRCAIELAPYEPPVAAPRASDASSLSLLEHASSGAGVLSEGLFFGESSCLLQDYPDPVPGDSRCDRFATRSSSTSFLWDTHLARSERWVFLCEVESP